jgi:stage III sporulation protein AH
MEDKSRLRIKVLLIISCCIILILSLIVVYQARIINEIKNKQTSEFFLETKLKKEQILANTLKRLKDLIDDKNVSKENRDKAAGIYTNLALAANYEFKIETILKSKGYEDAIATISDDKARVIIEYNKNLKSEQVSEIYDVVKDITGIKDVEIELKK